MWQLWLSKTKPFGGWNTRRDETRISLIGIPLDISNSYSPGTKFAPEAIRRVSESLEWYSFYSEKDFSEYGLYDEGDLVLSPGKMIENLDLIGEALKDIRGEKRLPIMLGGEHTITVGAKKIIDDDTLLIVFDAHLDLRDDYLNSRLNHATCLRRLLDDHPVSNIVFIGTRAVSVEELEYVKKNDIKYITSRRLWLYGPGESIKRLQKIMDDYEKIYLSIDIDVVDPGYAPGVGTPEPLGLDPHSLMQMLVTIIDERLIGIDIVEVNPLRDAGDATSALAAKIIMEAVIRYCSKSKSCK